MTDIFLKILELSISSSFIILSIAVLRLFMKKTPKWIFCLLWAFAGIRLVLPFSFECIFSLVPNLPANTVHPQGGSVAETSSLPLILSVIWLFGLAAVILYGIISYLRLYLLIRPSVKLENNVYICDDIDSPFIFGIIGPRIYVPSCLSREHIDRAVKHEYAHLSRLDHLWKPLGFFILALHWFNPIVILGYILLCRDIEKACDEKVISKMNNEDKLDYLESLVFCSVHKRKIFICPVAFGEIGVKARVKLILDYKRPTAWMLMLCLIFSVVITLCFFTSPIIIDTSEPQRSENRQSEEVDPSVFSSSDYYDMIEQNPKGNSSPTIPDVPTYFDIYKPNNTPSSSLDSMIDRYTNTPTAPDPRPKVDITPGISPFEKQQQSLKEQRSNNWPTINIYP